MKRWAAALLVVAAVLGAPSAAVGGELLGHTSSDGRITVGPEGRSVYVGGAFTYARDGRGQLRLISDTEPDGQLQIAPRGDWAVIATQSLAGWIYLLSRDPATGLLTHQSSFQLRAYDLAISPDGRFVYAVTGDQVVVLERRGLQLTRVGAVYGGEAPGDVGWLRRAYELTMTPDGLGLFVAGESGFHELRRDPGTGGLTPLDGAAEENEQARNTPSVELLEGGRRVLVARANGLASGDGILTYRRDPGSGALTQQDSVAHSCDEPRYICRDAALTASPDGALVVATSSHEPLLRAYRPTDAGLEEVQRSSLAQRDQFAIWGQAWTPDSQTLFTSAGALLSGWVRSPGADGLTLAGTVKVPRRFIDKDIFNPLVTGVTIEDGAAFVNSSNVALRVKQPSWATAIRISSSPSFDGVAARRLDPTGRYEWRLRDAGPARDVRQVYIQYMRHEIFPAGVPLQTASDDVVLDPRPPVVVSARLRRAAARSARSSAARRRARGSRLTLRARDNRSGVRSVQVTTRRSRPGRARKYSRRLALRGQPRRVWVRVIDRAGNKSRWKPVRRR